MYSKYAEEIKNFLIEITNFNNIYGTEFDDHEKPMIEIEETPSMKPVYINKNKQEYVFIEPSCNSVRVNVKIKQSDDIEKFLCKRFFSFIMKRAVSFGILRKKAIEGYDVSFLITCKEIKESRTRAIDFIISFIEQINKEINEMKLEINSKARVLSNELSTSFIC